MNKRNLGKSGLEIGEVGLGCEGLLDKNIHYISSALDLMEKEGANGIDLYSPNPEMRSNLGKALAGRRDKFLLQGHICTIWQKNQYKRTRKIEEVQAGFEDQLSRLQTDYLDIGMIHYIDSAADLMEVLDGPVMMYADKLEQEGKVRAIGLSSHNPVVALDAIKSGLFQVLMFSINPCYDLQPPNEDVEQLWNREKYKQHLLNMDPAREALYETCLNAGVGITVMKALGGGDLLKAEQSLAGIALTLNQCFAYALDRPAVACVFAGARNLEELKTALEFGNANQSEKDYAAALASFPRISWKGHCMYCGHCAPCPQEIDVATVTKLLNLALAQNEIPETVREHYFSLPKNAEDCILCGQCESRCPFEVPVRENMQKAQKLFSIN